MCARIIIFLSLIFVLMDAGQTVFEVFLVVVYELMADEI